MKLITNRYTADELHEKTLNIVKYNNEVIGDDEERLFSVSLTRAFYTDQNNDLYLIETKGNTGSKLIKIDPEHLKAMYVLYENIADALKLEKE